MNASLDEKLKSVKWGEFKLGDLFNKIKTNTLKFKTSEIPSYKTPKYDLPALTAGIENQGLNNYVPSERATILKNVISISANGANTGATFYQSKEFTVLQDAYAVKWIYDSSVLSDNQYLFLTSSISKTIYGNYEWTNKASWNRIKKDKIQLPLNHSNEIDFDFMESFISELEQERINKLNAYLEASGLKDYELTEEEKTVLKGYENWTWEGFNLEELFGKSTRGKRLKSEDRAIGDLPFVTAGEANEGISAFISNDVDVFSRNTTTIDMFGSAKYRNYDYGADDHVAVVHTENLKKHTSIFVTAAIHKSSHAGKFDYSHNFYAKDADELIIQLPTQNSLPDYKSMETFIRAIEKLVIKDVVLYVEKRLGAMNEVVYFQSSSPTLAAEE